MTPWPESNPEFVAVLDNIRSLHNVGSIFRTADGAGVGGLILCGITGKPPRSEIRKAALGAEEVVPWKYLPTPLEAVETLRQQGYFIIGLEKTENSKLIYDIEFEVPVALVVGHEFHGVSEPVLSACHVVAHLPMLGHKISLNVSVAFGIAAYELRRRMRAKQRIAWE
ncbi:MAG: TrmH family RNA methyltransferase [Calditrichaeota bacterium]|nr:MAG: TrmH family RNA methyltransferase [Calditrichota bacterium]